MNYLGKSCHTQVDRLMYMQQPVKQYNKNTLPLRQQEKYFLKTLQIKLPRKLQ